MTIPRWTHPLTIHELDGYQFGIRVQDGRGRFTYSAHGIRTEAEAFAEAEVITTGPDWPGLTATVVRRTVTVGPWEPVEPDGPPDPAHPAGSG